MKTNKPKVQKKVAKKAAKKDLEKTLTDRILEVVQQLAHDAERIGVDIQKIGRNVSKDLVKRFTAVKAAADKKLKPEGSTKEKPKKLASASTTKSANKKVKKEVAQANKTVKAAAAKTKSASRSVKVVPIVTLEKVEEAIAKPAATKTVAPAAKKPALKTIPASANKTKKATVKKTPAKPDKEGGVN